MRLPRLPRCVRLHSSIDSDPWESAETPDRGYRANLWPLWCRYPDQIESDLKIHCHGTDIRWWHRGDRDERGCLKLSSRLLLNLIRGLPEDSEFKTHAAEPFGRGGDWSILKKMTAALHNEVAAYRASKYAGTPHEYEYDVFISPSEARERAEEEAAEEEFHDREFGKLLSIFN